MDARYFLDEAQMWEVRAMVRGISKRGREIWEAMRVHGWMVLSALGSKAQSPMELLPFGWDKKEEVSKEEMEKDKAELERMLKEAREWNRRKGA